MANKNKNKNTDKSPAPATAAQVQDAENVTTTTPAVDGAATEGPGRGRRGRSSGNLILDPDTKEEIVIVGSENPVEQASKYTRVFLAAKMEYSGGYKKFITHKGYSNSDFPKELENTAHMNVNLVSIAVLGDRASKGDEEAKAVLSIISQFIGKAEETAKESAAMSHLEALKALGINVDAVKLPATATSKAATAKAH
jgi:hypothetical protein